MSKKVVNLITLSIQKILMEEKISMKLMIILNQKEAELL